MLLIPIPRRHKQVDLSEVKASVFYIASSRPARDTWWAILVSEVLGFKNQTNKKIVVA